MRMWCVDPKLLCRQHLLGEHVEHHMFVGFITKRRSIKGFVNKGLVEVHNIKSRHEELVKEMLSRGMNHQSPLKDFTDWNEGKVDRPGNITELIRRCSRCKSRIQKENL